MCVAAVALAARSTSASTSASGTDDALDLGDLGEDEQRLDALLGPRPELGVEVLVGLAGDLEVGLLADPLAGERAAELVVHHLDLLVDQDVGELERGVGDGVVDDPVGELVAGPVEGVALEPTAGSRRAASSRSAKSPIVESELVVGVGQDLLAKLAQLDREVGLLAGQRLLGVVVREDDVELRRARRVERRRGGPRSPGSAAPRR